MSENKPQEERRKRARAWARSSLADVAGHGHSPDEADVKALPGRARTLAREIIDEARSAHKDGFQGRAIQAAREGFHVLANDLADSGWVPPTRDQRPDAEILDEIQGVIR